MKDVVIVVGAGEIGQAIARRGGAGRHVVLADLRPEAAWAAAKILKDAGVATSAAQTDLASRDRADNSALRNAGRRDCVPEIHKPSRTSPV